MEREERFEAIAAMDTTSIVGLADQILESLTVEIVRGPTVGLLMVRHEDPVERLTFNFVEVTVTEAEIAVDGVHGYAMVMGRDPEHALAGAIVDAAIEIDHMLAPDARAALRKCLVEQESRWIREWGEVEPTTVRFEEAL